MKGDLKSVYEGEFAENKKDGEGTETNPGGFTYTGHWKQGKYVWLCFVCNSIFMKFVQNGIGTLDSPDATYTGSFVDGLRGWMSFFYYVLCYSVYICYMCYMIDRWSWCDYVQD